MGLFGKDKGFTKQEGERLIDVQIESRDLLREMAGNSSSPGGGSVLNAPKKVVHLLSRHSDKTWPFVVFAIILHAFFLLSGRVHTFSFGDVWLWMHIFGAMFLGILFYHDPRDGTGWQTYTFFMVLGAFAYVWPLLLTKASTWLPIAKPLFQFLMLVAPVLVLYAFLNPGDSVTRLLASLFFFALFLFVILAMVLPNAQVSTAQTIAILPSPAELWDNMHTVWSRFGDFLGGAGGAAGQSVENARKALNGSLSYATAEYYTGTVDTNTNAPLGVSMTNAKPFYTKFRLSSDDIIVDAELRARTLLDNSITVTTLCYAEVPVASGKRTVIAGQRVTPNKLTIDYTGAFEDRRDISCTIPKESFTAEVPAGRTTTATVVFNSTFPFETWGYTTYAYMDRDLIRSMRVDNIDPASVLEIPSMPVPKYTAGPVAIGMSSDTQPYGYDPRDVDASLPLFGFTIDSIWQGKGALRDITEANIYVPDVLQLRTDECAPKDLVQYPPSAWYDAAGAVNGYEKYSLSPTTLARLRQNSETRYLTVRCPLELSGKRAVLGPSGAGIYTFYVNVKYTYVLQTRTSVSVENDAQVTP